MTREGRPQISVLLPVVAPEARYFVPAIRSVLAQTFGDFELVIVEEPSNASVADLLSEFDDSRIRHLHHPHRTSLTEQLNRGLQEARGEFIARFDADDLCEPRRLELQLAFLRGHPEVHVVGSNITIIDSHGEEIGRRSYPTSPEAIRKAMPRYNAIAHPSVMFRTEAVRDFRGWRGAEFTAAEDYELWSRMLVAGKNLANLDEYLIRYRIHPGATKATKIRQTLSGTILVKERYWRSGMDLKSRLVMNAERVLMFVPPAITYRLFKLARIRRKATGHSVS